MHVVSSSTCTATKSLPPRDLLIGIHWPLSAFFSIRTILYSLLSKAFLSVTTTGGFLFLFPHGTNHCTASFSPFRASNGAWHLHIQILEHHTTLTRSSTCNKILFCLQVEYFWIKCGRFKIYYKIHNITSLGKMFYLLNDSFLHLHTLRLFYY